MTNPADYFMAIMSKETLEIEEEEAAATGGNNQLMEQKQSIQEKYLQKVAYFDKCYQESPLKNDYVQVYPGI